MNCPKCHDNNYTKDGLVRGLQRYKCKCCGYRYTVMKKSDVKSIETKRMALEMYLEGLGFRAIGRLLKISYATVYYWIRDWGEKANAIKNTETATIVELDELHSYVSNKKTTAGCGLLLIDMEKGLSLLCVEHEGRRQV